VQKHLNLEDCESMRSTWLRRNGPQTSPLEEKRNNIGGKRQDRQHFD